MTRLLISDLKERKINIKTEKVLRNKSSKSSRFIAFD